MPIFWKKRPRTLLCILRIGIFLVKIFLFRFFLFKFFLFKFFLFKVLFKLFKKFVLLRRLW